MSVNVRDIQDIVSKLGSPAGLDQSKLQRFVRILKGETGYVHLRLLVAQLAQSLIPETSGPRIRTAILRLAGLSIAPDVGFAGKPTILGTRNIEQLLTIGRRCYFNVGCVLDVHSYMAIGDDVHLGHQVMLLTHSHHLGPSFRRSGFLEAKAIRIGNGAWLGARSTILPGVTIGEGAIVAAGAVVVKDVAPNTVVGGVPATLVRNLDDVAGD